MDIEAIAEAFRKTGKKKSDLAKVLGISPSGVTDILDGTRKIKLHEAPKIAAFFGWGTVQIVGIVRAGGEAVYPQEANLGLVKAIDGTGPNTVAVEIQGTSMGTELDGMIVYYNDVRHPPTDDLHRQLCVIGLSDERIVLKKLVPTRRKKFFNLLSTSSDPLLDKEVEWAAKIVGILPSSLVKID
ncbi:MAG TPA: helix-turn-helix transcriptional regulator [Bryobacteraceae bacterium]|nr:helix-turn-helix transcriptional regulator [Bryobacteraceae bacterium]